MNQEDLAEPPRGAREVRQIRLVKVMDHRKVQTIGIIDDGSGEGAEDTNFRIFLKIAAIIISGIFLAYFFTQVVGASTSMAFILLAAQGAFLAYGVFEWIRNPRM